MDINNLISNFGFPIACCIVMGLFIYQMWQRINATLDKITETNNQLVLTNQALISNIQEDLTEIKNKILT